MLHHTAGFCSFSSLYMIPSYRHTSFMYKFICLVSFCLFATVNNDPNNILITVVWMYVSGSPQYLRSWTSGSDGTLMLDFLKNCQVPSVAVVPYDKFTAVCGCSSFSRSYQHFLVSIFMLFLGSVKKYLITVLICISLMTKYIKHFLVGVVIISSLLL